MPKYIATYDLEDTYPSPYGPFRDAAEELGWSSWIQGRSGTWSRLPNTTLIGDFADLDAAVAALKAAKRQAAKEIGRAVNMPKFVVAERGLCKFDSDEQVEE